MRVIERKMVDAVENRRNWRESNTEVMVNQYGTFVRLYSTIIYGKVRGKEYFSDGGWSTPTTSSRLRALGADYSTNEKKNLCKMRTTSEMSNLYCFGCMNPKY